MRSVVCGVALVVACACGPVTSLTSSANPPLASKPALPASEIDAILAPWSGKDSPGCAVGVFQNGAMAYARGYGMASLEHDAPITPDSVFYAGSVSKQFTAMAAALAIEQGTLAYEDPIRKYLPELPGYADAIRVRHLLHHTSGLRDYNTLLAIAGHRDEVAWDNRAVLRITAKQKALNFSPGDEYLYSNTGYTLLATIVERATGTPFAAFADRHIFTPLGMTASHFHVDARRLVRGRALGYGGRAGAWTLDTPINERAGAGGLYTNVPDLLKWDENFYTGKVGGADLLKRLQARGTLNDGTTLPYAWGLQIGKYRGLATVEHSGSLGGYRAYLLRMPSQHASVALLCNGSSIVPSRLAQRVADILPGIRFPDGVPRTPPPASARPQARRAPRIGSAGLEQEYAGRYYSDELDVVFTITAKTGAVYLRRESDTSPVPMQPGADGDVFRVHGMTVRFRRDESARAVTGLMVDSGRVRGIRFVRR